MVSSEDIKRGLERKRSGKSEDDIYCHDCGLGNPKYANFCKDCGTVLYPELKDVRDEIKFSGLSPAESMYLLNNRSDILEMIKVTFLDMIDRNVLETTSRQVLKGFLAKKEKTETYIQGGATFYDVLMPHEEVFQKAMDTKPDLTLEKFTKKLVKKLGKFKYKTSRGKIKFDFPSYRNEKIRDPMIDRGYLEIEKTKSMGLISRNNYELTDYGLNLKNKIETLLLKGEKLDEYVQNDPKRTQDTSNALSTRIFLLKQEDEVILNEFSKELSKVIANKDTSRIQPF